MSAEGNAVRIRFADRVEPQLRPVPDSTVQVSCHLHHDPDTGAPIRPDS